MPHSFELRLAEAWPPEEWREVVILLAVSGGADSVALLRGLVAIHQRTPANLVVAHFNHRLREDADQDERFVRELCQCQDIRCEVGYPAGHLRDSSRGSLEAESRAARYDFLATTAGRIGARYVATAHTADDQAETLLHRIVRGTGIRGLAGIPRSRELAPNLTLLRPLLSFRRSEILDYLRALRQSCRYDESNHDHRFVRNQIRHELLPLLKENYNAEVVDALTRLAAIAGETQSYIEAVAHDQLMASATCSGDCVRIQCAPLGSQPFIIIITTLVLAWRGQRWPEQAMTADKWEQLRSLIVTHDDTSTEPVVLPGGIRAEKKDGQLVLTRPSG